jgi:hypothetical protein
VVVVTVVTSIRVKVGFRFSNVVGLYQCISSHNGTNPVKLPVLTVVELEDDALFALKEGGRSENVEMQEINATAPPNVVNPTRNVRRCPRIRHFHLWLHAVFGKSRRYVGVE